MNKNIDIQLTDVAGYTKKFRTLRELRDFMNKEALFWKKRYDALRDTRTRRIHQHLGYFSHFQAAVSEIDSWSRGEVSEWDEDTLRQQLTQLRRRNLTDASSAWLYSGHAFTPIYVDCHSHEDGYNVCFGDVCGGWSRSVFVALHPMAGRGKWSIRGWINSGNSAAGHNSSGLCLSGQGMWKNSVWLLSSDEGC